MKLFNLISKIPKADSAQTDLYTHILHQGMSILLRLLAPIAPHITHQLWQELKFADLLINATWPKINSAAMQVTQIELGVQINGKLRSRITVPTDADTKTIEAIATADAKVQQAIVDKLIKKIIVVPGRMVSIVIGDK